MAFGTFRRPGPRLFHAGADPGGGGAASGGVGRRPRLQRRQSFSEAETLPPFFSSSSITRL